jgi:hypothetical protein
MKSKLLGIGRSPEKDFTTATVLAVCGFVPDTLTHVEKHALVALLLDDPGMTSFSQKHRNSVPAPSNLI